MIFLLGECTMKHLTLRYSITQFSFWAATTGAASFATTYLLSYGLSANGIGLLLAVAGVLSCVTQPILADFLDRHHAFLLPKLLLGISVLCTLCFCILLFPSVSPELLAVCYLVALWLSDAITPLINALCVAYDQAGYPIHYGVARGFGSAASAISSLALGHILAKFGNRWMLLLLIGFRLVSIGAFVGYPAVEKVTVSKKSSRHQPSFFTFLRKYRRYCVSLLGILFLGMFHAMTETYLIAIVSPLGGDSRHVGTALFLASLVGTPVIFCFGWIRKHLSDALLLKIAALSFLLKSILFCFAGNIAMIYGLQLLHMTSYAFLAPAQVTYAQSRINSEDMVKGQAFCTAAYALGCSAGNFAGGQFLSLGVHTFLLAGVAMALLGTVVLFSTVDP